MKTTHILIGLMAAGSMMMAGSVTIPNSFTAGTAAKASEVNGNFAAVKTAVNGNAGDISTNKGKITTNTSNITTNTNGVATNANDIASNKSDIQANAVGASMWVRDHEGNIHPTVTIGSQVWMADNMYVTTYPNGDPIENGDWADGDDDDFVYPIKKPSDYVGSDNAPVAGKGDIDIKRYGLLYQYLAAVKNDTSANNAQGICPDGWHIPTNTDWDALHVTLGDDTPANGWSSEGEIGDQLKIGGKSGFSALLAGYHGTGATDYYSRGKYTYFWSANEVHAGFRGLKNSSTGLQRSVNGAGGGYGFNVRCIKN